MTGGGTENKKEVGEKREMEKVKNKGRREVVSRSNCKSKNNDTDHQITEQTHTLETEKLGNHSSD